MLIVASKIPIPRVQDLVLEGKNLVIKPRFPFDEVVKIRISGECGAHRDALRTDGTFCRLNGRNSKIIASNGNPILILDKLVGDERLYA